MTKKFWKDWQNRIGETKRIYGYWPNSSKSGGQLITYLPYKIISTKFHGDAVDMVVEITSETLHNTHHLENKYITLHRNEISSIEFKKYE